MRSKRAEQPVVFVLYFVLRALVLVTLVRSAFLGHYEHMMLCVLTLVLLLVPSLIEHTLDIELPDLLESIILLFIFAAEILGEIDAFYIRIPFWDTILHTTWGFLCAGIGFALFDILNRSDSSKIKLTPLYMAVSAVAFSMCIGACWEIFEYLADSFIGVDMQKDTLVQTINTVWLDPTNSNVTIPRCAISSQLRLRWRPARLSRFPAVTWTLASTIPWRILLSTLLARWCLPSLDSPTLRRATATR